MKNFSFLNASFLFNALIGALCFACTVTSSATMAATPKNNAVSCPLAYKAVTTSAQAIDVARQAMQAYQLSSLRQQCLQFMVEEPSKATNYFTVDVYEKHDAACGGDPNTSPRILSMQVQHGGQVLTDNIEGQFAAPRCPLSKTPSKIQ